MPRTSSPTRTKTAKSSTDNEPTGRWQTRKTGRPLQKTKEFAAMQSGQRDAPSERYPCKLLFSFLPERRAYEKALEPPAQTKAGIVAARQVPKRKRAKFPNGNAPSSQTEMRQVPKRKRAKFPNGNAPSSQISEKIFDCSKQTPYLCCGESNTSETIKAPDKT